MLYQWMGRALPKDWVVPLLTRKISPIFLLTLVSFLCCFFRPSRRRNKYATLFPSGHFLLRVCHSCTLDAILPWSSVGLMSCMLHSQAFFFVCLLIVTSLWMDGARLSHFSCRLNFRVGLSFVCFFSSVGDSPETIENLCALASNSCMLCSLSQLKRTTRHTTAHNPERLA